MTQYAALQQIGKDCAECIVEMVAALECDYDRLKELRAEKRDLEDTQRHALPENADDATAELVDWNTINDEELADLEKAAGDFESRESAEQHIQEDPLSIELMGTWSLGEDPVADRALILLSTGGPATRIVCELDDNREPHRAWIEAQDWGTQWTEYRGDVISQDDLLTYCRCFYFGEG